MMVGYFLGGLGPLGWMIPVGVDLLYIAANFPLMGGYMKGLRCPASAYELWLIGEGTKPLDKRRPILLHCIGRCGLGLPSWGV
jgi:hypothetical protein